jgi:hypothetical protein
LIGIVAMDMATTLPSPSKSPALDGQLTSPDPEETRTPSLLMLAHPAPDH